MAETNEAVEYSADIRGLVIPVEWDDEGQATAVAISAFDETEYWVTRGAKGARLLALVHREVEVHGLVQDMGSGKKLIRVERYRSVPAKEGSKRGRTNG